MSTLIPVAGQMTQVMMGQSQAGLLESAFGHFLNLELQGDQLNAQKMREFATQVTVSITQHVDVLSRALPFAERQNIERIARENRLDVHSAQIEYLANAYMFRAIRDYFDLPSGNAFSQFDAGGFLAFTGNGSIVASPPEAASGRRRTLHYSKMPSRDNSVETRSYQGDLLGDVMVGDRLATSAFTTSAVRMLLTIPARQALLFDAIRESTLAGTASVSMIMTRRP
jgi:hypothetical protein